MTRITLYYAASDKASPDRINDGLGINIDETVELALKMIGARNAVREHFDSVKCVVRQEGAVGRYSTILETLNPEILKEATKLYISQAGVPEIVGNGSNYDVAERVFRQLGMELKRRFFGAALGKNVERIWYNLP